MDATQYEEVVKLFMDYLKIVVPIILVVLIIQIIAMWKVFTKAGEAGWKALIPIYNSYIYFKIAGVPMLFWVSILLSVLSVIQNQIIIYVALIGTIIVTIYQAYKLAKAFGHGVGYTLGLLFLDTIFLLIIGFGSSTYQLTEEEKMAF